MILTVVLTVLMFGGTRLLAESVENKPVESPQTTPTEENLEPKATGDEGTPLDNEESKAASSENTELGGVTRPENSQEATADEEKNVPAQAQEATEAKTTEEKANAQDENAQVEGQDRAAQAAPTQAPQAAPAQAPATPAQANPSAPAPAPAPADPNAQPKPPAKNADPEINTNNDKELKDLQAKIKAEGNKDKKAELQKEYNKKYLEKLNEAAKDKTDPNTAKRLEGDDIAKYNAIKAKQEEIDKKLNDASSKPEDIQKDIDELNKLLGGFTPPRALTSDEESALSKLQETPYVPGVNDADGTEGKKLFDAYEKAKDALKKALDPKAEAKSKEELEKLVKNFKDAEAALKKGIEDGKVSPKYAGNNPEISIFPLDGYGKAGNELDEKNNGKDKDTYYIPDNTDLNLLFQVNKNKEADGSNQKFTFTFKGLKPEGSADLPNPSLKDLVFLNGKPVELTKNNDGSYSFTTTADQNFGIAQLKFNMPGFRAKFHEGFELTLEGTGGANKVTKKFLITKKGYENEADLGGIGSKDPKTAPEVDAGNTQNNIVDANTDKVFNFFTILKKNNAYVDKVLVNSANGESLPLSSVDITITAPKNFDGNFAEFIHKSGLKYHDLGNGKYQLKLDLKSFNKDDKFKVDGDKLYYGTEEIKGANITDAVLEAAGKKKYLDEQGNPHDVTSTTVLEGTLEGTNYQVRYDSKSNTQSLWKKTTNADGSYYYTKVGDFKDGKLESDNKTFEIHGKELTSHTGEKEVYHGNVVNKKNGEADPTVTPTYKGKQVTVTETGKTGMSYGGTIVEGKIFEQTGKEENDIKYLADQAGLTGYERAWIDGTGKYHASQNAAGTLKEVKNAVFKGDYIVDGLTYRKNLVLIDKFGRPMKNITVEKNGAVYTFTKTKDDGKTEKIEINGDTGACKDIYGNRNITIGTNNQEELLVNNKNYIEDKANYDSINGSYYYDETKKKFVGVDKDKVIGGKFYENLNKAGLSGRTIEAYDKEVATDPNTPNSKEKRSYELAQNTQRYYGSLDKKDYYTIGNRTYLKRSLGDKSYLESADGGDANIIADFAGEYVLQTLGDKKLITSERDIFEAVQKSVFALRFPGFLAGKNIVYNIKAEVSAKYKDPAKNDAEVSIFKKTDGTDLEKKEINHYFTLKLSEGGTISFNKSVPKALKSTPDHNFFNIFYRDGNDRQRDNLVKDLLRLKAEEDKKAANPQGQENKNLSEAEKKAQEETKAKLDLLNKLQAELGRLYNGAQFALDNNGNLIFKRNGETVDIERSLLWEITFSTSKGALFPEDKDTQIVVEDHNMDNRLVYDEIIINDTVEKWEKAKKDWEDAEKAKKQADANYVIQQFKGTDEYFFLDQVQDIRLGISRGFIKGDFISIGKGFTITRQQIIDALKNADTGAITLDQNGANVTVTVTRDTAKGQIRIKVKNAFYKKNDSYNANDKNSNKFYSPAQKAYEKQLKELKGKLNDPNSDFKAVATDNDVDKTIEAFDKSFESFVKKIYGKDSDCAGVLTHLFKERLSQISKTKENGTAKTVDEIVAELNGIKTKMKDAMKDMGLKYLDSKKGDYKFDDMRFNAIRFALNPNMEIGGPLTKQKSKKFAITSVIVADIDIPYTDEFGKALTNKDMYIKAAIDEIKSDKKFGTEQKEENFDTDKWNQSEDSFRKVMEEAYRRVNEKIDATDDTKIKIKDLVTVDSTKSYAEGKYAIKNANQIQAEDLAVNNKMLLNKSYESINPWYVLRKNDQGTYEWKTLEELVDGADAKAAVRSKVGDKPIDLAGYYMGDKGYGRARFSNYVDYKLPKLKQGPGVFGEDNKWSHKLCHPGVLGSCIGSTGNNPVPPEPGKPGKPLDKTTANDSFALSYAPMSIKPTKENPGVKKTANTDNVDIEGDDDKKVDFTININVSQMTQTDQEIDNALNNKKEKVDPKDYVNGRYHYKKDTLIMDILPKIFKLTDETKIDLTIHSEALKKGGVNQNIFKDEAAVKTWKAGVEYKRVDDLKAYLDGLSGYKKEVLQKAYDEAIKSGKIKEGEKVQAILAWLPEFTAPSGSENHFTFELKNVLVSKKDFKDYLDNGVGESYTNHATFGDKGLVYFGSTTVTVRKGKEGKVDKFLRVYDDEGKIINKDTNKEWFKGNARLKFGDKFDYKLKYKNNIDITKTGKTSLMLSEINLDDTFKTVKDKGLRPVLNGFVEIQKGYEDRFEVKYTIKGQTYTKEQIEKAMEDAKKAGKESELKLKDVTKISIASKTPNVPSGEYREFILPMMIPNLDAKIENGKVVYIGTDGEKHELGNAEEFFNLKDLKDPKKEMAFDNSIEGSNTVTVYLEKNRFIRLFKEFFDRQGNEIKKNRPEMRFEIYQYETDENGKQIGEKVKFKDKNGKEIQLVVNEKNNFTDMVNNLPLFKKFIEVEKDSVDDKGNIVKGKTIEKTTYYKYELREVNSNGYKVDFEIVDKGDDELGFVIKAKNTELPPETPPGPRDYPRNFKIRFSVNKVWKVLNGGATPSIQVELYANGKATGKVLTLGVNGSWSASFEDLPAKDADGKDIVYTVRELGEAKGITKIGEREFEVEYAGDIKDGFTITNTEVPPEEPHNPPEDHDTPPEDHDTPPEDNIIPKTGVSEDLSSIYFAFVLLLGLVFIKRKYLAK